MLVLIVTIRSLGVLGLSPEQVVALASGVFILPFLLFSATAGELADKLPKHRLARWLKGAEVGSMLLAAWSLGLEPGPLLLVALFATGVQSAFFGPLKYGILPQLLDEDDLVGGNALVEMGTSLAILLGTLAGGLLFELGPRGPAVTGACPVALGLLGWGASLQVPAVRSENPGLRVSRNPLAPTLETLRISRANRAVYLSVLAISWFWFFGVAILALLPAYTKDALGGGPSVITFFLALFCVGNGVGSLVCERLSGRRVELGLVPLGSLGMTWFALDLFLATPAAPFAAPGALTGVRALLAEPHALRIAADFALLAASCGLFVVPLYALVQQRSEPSQRSRVIAGSNIIGAL